MLESNEKALFQLAMGNSRYALELASSQVVKGQILLNLGRFQEAIDTVDGEQDLYGRLILAKALFANGEFQRALIEVQKLKESQLENQTEFLNFKSQLDVLSRKIEIELTNSSSVGNINDAAYLSSFKPQAVLQGDKKQVAALAID